MKTINSYLNFPGNTEQAFTFYKDVFEGEILGIQRFKDMPQDMPAESKVPEGDQDKVMHIALKIKGGILLMGSDAIESMGPPLIMGNNFYLTIDAESKEEADTLFTRLAEGGKVVMPMADAFWGAYFGMVTDKFGIQWMISYAENSNK